MYNPPLFFEGQISGSAGDLFVFRSLPFAAVPPEHIAKNAKMWYNIYGNFAGPETALRDFPEEGVPWHSILG